MITRRAFAVLAAITAAAWSRAQANETVRVLSPEPQLIAKVADLARSLSSSIISVAAAPGYGPVQNVNTLLRRSNIEVAVLPADVLEYIRHSQIQREAAEALRYIAQLYAAPVHVLAGRQLTSIAQLAGERISFGPQDSVSYVSGTQIFGLLGLPMQPVILERSETLSRLRRREISAVVHIGNAPDRMFSGLNRQQDAVHFLAVPMAPALSGSYLPAQLSIQDYPLLIGEGEAGSGMPVPTVEVPMLLAVYNWPFGGPAHRTLSLLAAEFSRIATITLGAPGWVRFVPDTASRPVARILASPPRQLTSKQREALFRQFERWREQRQREALFEDYLHWLQDHQQLR